MPHRFTIHAPGPSEKSAAALDHQLWVSEIIADGRILRPDEIERRGNWSLDYFQLSHVGDPGPATLSFSAHTAVVRFSRSPWSGRARISWSDQSMVIDLHCVDGNQDAVLVDLPGWQPPWWSWSPFAAVVAAGWLLLRPWSSSQRTESWLIAVLVAVHVLVWAALPIGTVTDSLDYLPNLRQNLSGGYATYFPPGYGLFQAAAMGLPGPGIGGKVALLQHALMVLSLCGLWRLLREWSPWTLSTAWLAGVTWLSPTLFLPQAVLSENIALFTMVGSLYFAWRQARQPGMWTGLAAGFCLGLGTIARVVPLAACGPAMLLILLGVRPLRLAVRRGALVFGSAAIVIATPMLWFWLHGNAPALSSGIGRHLYNRVVNEQKLLDEDGPATRQVRDLLPGVDLGATYHWDLAERLTAAAGGERAEALIGQVAGEAIRRRPLDYILFTFPHAWRNLIADPIDFLLRAGGTPSHEPAMEMVPVVGYSAAAGTLAWSLAERFGFWWRLLCWLSVAGVAVIPWLPSRRLLCALAFVPASYIVTTSFVEYFLPRYNVAITPFIAGIACMPLAWLAALVRSRRPTVEEGHPGVESGQPAGITAGRGTRPPRR